MATPSGADAFDYGTAQRHSARKLTTHQQAVLIQILLVFPEQEVRVCYRPDVGDARAYAENFVTVFKAVGWQIDEAEPAPDGLRDATGLALAVGEEKKIPHAALALRDALLIYRIEADFLCRHGSVKSGSFALVIGAHR
jgi:hypothetical protein